MCGPFRRVFLQESQVLRSQGYRMQLSSVPARMHCIAYICRLQSYSISESRPITVYKRCTLIIRHTQYINMWGTSSCVIACRLLLLDAHGKQLRDQCDKLSHAHNVLSKYKTALGAVVLYTHSYTVQQASAPAVIKYNYNMNTLDYAKHHVQYVLSHAAA
jgi:hypothetical protein